MTQDLNNVPVRRVRDKVPSLKKDGEVYVFNRQAIMFFEHYTQTMDVEKSLEAAGVEGRRRSEFLDNPYIVGELDRIQQAWSLQHRMTVGFASGEHLRLMQKFENEFDRESGKVKSSYAGHLAKMSEAAMKAVGLIGSDNSPTVPNVSIHLSLGGEQPMIIEGKTNEDVG